MITRKCFELAQTIKLINEKGWFRCGYARCVSAIAGWHVVQFSVCDASCGNATKLWLESGRQQPPCFSSTLSTTTHSFPPAHPPPTPHHSKYPHQHDSPPNTHHPTPHQPTMPLTWLLRSKARFSYLNSRLRLHSNLIVLWRIRWHIYYYENGNDIVQRNNTENKYQNNCLYMYKQLSEKERNKLNRLVKTCLRLFCPL